MPIVAPGDAIVCVGDTLAVRCRLVRVGRVRQEGVFVFFFVFLFSFCFVVSFCFFVLFC
jgi:hypothetical protein